jgi:hypothetical protein
MKDLRWTAIGAAAFLLAACSPWDKYAALESQQYFGEYVHTMREEWGTPVHRTHLLTGGWFTQFRKPNGCQASVWTNDLDIVSRLTVEGPSSCATAE